MCIRDRVRKEFEELVDKLGIPVIGGSWVADNFYMEHPLYYGPSGNIGPRTGNFILQNADYILTLGNSLGFRQTGFNQDAFAPVSYTHLDVYKRQCLRSGERKCA